MFNNIGKKLMTLAKILFWVVAVFSVIGGIAVMVVGPTAAGMTGYGSGVTAVSIITGIFMIAFGVLFAWLGNLGLYAFGQLVDDTHAIRMSKEN